MSDAEQTVPNLAEEVVRAWRMLYPDPDRTNGRRGDPAGRAELRRAATPGAVMVVPAFYDILLVVQERGIDLPSRSDALLYQRLAVAVGALAERRSGEGGGRHFAAMLGGSSKAEERRFKTTRFQALIAALDRGPDAELLTGLRRGMAIIGDDRFSVRPFVRDLLGWSDRTRIAWTFDYFGQGAHRQASATTPNTIEEQAQ